MSAAPETTAPGRTYEVRTYGCQKNGADTRAWVLWETVDALDQRLVSGLGLRSQQPQGSRSGADVGPER